MLLADIHFHGLWGVDDGAENEAETLEMLKKEYLGGTRIICFTPHYNPDYFDDYDAVPAYERFCLIKKRSETLFPELQLYFGNELCYHSEFAKGLVSGACRPLGEGNCILVDFHCNESPYEIERALMQISTTGFTAVLAHAERYDGVYNDRRLLESLISKGVYIQVNASSVLSEKKRIVRPLCKLIKQGYVNVIASDAHGALERPPLLSECADFVGSFLSKEKTEEIFYLTPKEILGINNVTETV